MQRGQRFWGPLAGAAIVACLAPANAAAEWPRFVTQPSFATGFSLQGSHGYEIAVTATGHKYVTLTASRGLSEASYTVPGRASSSKIVANFGSLGRISVRFDGSPIKRDKREPGRFSCAGPRSIHQPGTFSGVIRFEGEHGFTTIDSHHTKGVLRKSFRRVCKQRQTGRKRPTSEPGLAPPALRAKKKYQFVESTLLALSQHDGRLTALLINEAELTFGPKQSDRFALSFFAAGTRESVGRMWISRFYVNLGEGNELRATPPGTDPVEATVKISKPFSGRATYREDPGSPPTWAGSLGVRLPGGGTVPLTGPGFGVGLCQGTSEKQLHACERKSFGALRASPARALLQGSGSHSQAFWDARLSWSR